MTDRHDNPLPAEVKRGRGHYLDPDEGETTEFVAYPADADPADLLRQVGEALDAMFDEFPVPGELVDALIPSDLDFDEGRLAVAEAQDKRREKVAAEARDALAAYRRWKGQEESDG